MEAGYFLSWWRHSIHCAEIQQKGHCSPRLRCIVSGELKTASKEKSIIGSGCTGRGSQLGPVQNPRRGSKGRDVGWGQTLLLILDNKAVLGRMGCAGSSEGEDQITSEISGGDTDEDVLPWSA